MNCGECDSASVTPILLILKTTPLEAAVGSGKFGTPWERMHRASFRAAFSHCCSRAGAQSPVLGAFCFLLLERLACREQVLAGSPGRLELWAADPELLQADLRELPAAGGVGELCGRPLPLYDAGGGDGRRCGWWQGRGTHGRPSACCTCLWQVISAAWNCGEFGSIPGGKPWLEPVGSGKVGNPCLRMHWASFKAKASFCWRCCGVPALPPCESRCLQASSAAVDICFDTPVWNGGNSP